MKRRIVIAVIASVSLGLIISTGNYLLLNRIRRTILSGLDSLRASGYQVHLDTLSVNYWSQTLAVKQLSIKPESSDSCSARPSFTAEEISIHNINLLLLIFRRELHIGALNADGVRVRHVVGQHKRTHPTRFPLNGIFIGDLVFNDIMIQTSDSGTCRTKNSFEFSLRSKRLQSIHTGFDSIHWSVASVEVSPLVVRIPAKLYTMRAAKIAFSREQNSLRIDSVSLSPNAGKYEFARLVGKQTDRIVLSIPSIEMDGFRIEQNSRYAIRAGSIALSADVEIFRDKRLPFASKEKILPRDFVKQLPFDLQIDSVLLKKSRILYEEFPEEGDTPGRVLFAGLNASLHNLSSSSNENATMHATSGFMEKGKIAVDFVFPADPDKAYSLNGSLKNLTLSELNPLLIPMAQTEVRSGVLNDLSFQYQYNRLRADGQVTIDYNNLEILTYSKKTNKPNKFATMLISSFVLKKDMNKYERQGTILFYRDTKRSVINFWWKSIWSGVKSIFNLDRIMKIDRSKKKT